jgi:excisionase family DNA binding protein
MREFPKTLSVPEAGRKYLDVSKNTSYAAAKQGVIPTIRVGRLLRVPCALMDELMKEGRLPAKEVLASKRRARTIRRKRKAARAKREGAAEAAATAQT